MAVSTHISNSTVPDCRCACHDDATQAQHRVGALSPMPSCLCIGGHTGGIPTVHQAVGGSTAHTSTWHRSTLQTRMNPKQIHEVTNTDSVVRAHDGGAWMSRHTRGSRHGYPRYTSAHTVGRPWVARPHTRAHGTRARCRHE